MKTSELTGEALDFAVALIEYPEWKEQGYLEDFYDLKFDDGEVYSPSINWAQGGPIIEREQMDVQHYPDHWVAQLLANRNWRQTIPSAPGHEKAKILNSAYGSGPTLLIAAMRCYVASKLGAEVEIPDELKGESK